MPITPIELDKIEKTAENIYEAIVVMSKRARQINEEMKIQMNQEIDLIGTRSESEDEIDSNPDLANISIKYEKMKKPTQIAFDEMISGNLVYRYKDTSQE